jgi:hypothetical protein
VLYALGSTPPVVMAEMGHTSPHLALAIYAQAMGRDQAQLDQLRALVGDSEWAAMGSNGDMDASATLDAESADG